MNRDKFLQLLKVLLEGTREGKIKWHETVDEKAFRVAFGAGLVRIEDRSDPDSGIQYSVAFLQDKQGRTIDELSPAHPGASQLLHSLYAEARASAFAVDRVLDSILRDAEAGKTVEPPQDYLRRE